MFSTLTKSSFSGKQAARQILLLSATTGLSPEAKERISRSFEGKVDWPYLLDLAEAHGIAPLTAYNLINSRLTERIPGPYLEQLNQTYNNNLYRNIVLSEELAKVLSAYNQNGIPAIVLKGTVLAEQLYGNPGLRTVADIDILVQPDKIPLAGSLLLNLGYRKSVSKRVRVHPFHEEPYHKDMPLPFFIELHRNVDDPELVAIPREEVWHRAQRIDTPGVAAMVLSPEDNLLYLSNNLTKEDNQVLKSLCDINMLLNKYESTLDWEYIIASARSWGLKTAVYYSLERARDLFRAPVPDSAMAVLKPGALRLGLLNCLISRDTFISPISGYKLRNETALLFRSLTMERIHQTRLALSKYRGNNKWWLWPSTVVWVVAVFFTSLSRNILRR